MLAISIILMPAILYTIIEMLVLIVLIVVCIIKYNSNDCKDNKKQRIDCIARKYKYKIQTLFFVTNKDGSMVATVVSSFIKYVCGYFVIHFYEKKKRILT